MKQMILNLWYCQWKWNISNDNLKSNHDVTNEITYSDIVRGDINVVAASAKQVTVKNWAPFTNCITKIDETTDDGGDLDLVMPMYNLIEYSSNYSGKTGSLWFYSKDETTNFNANIANTDNFKSFKYKAKYRSI